MLPSLLFREVLSITGSMRRISAVLSVEPLDVYFEVR